MYLLVIIISIYLLSIIGVLVIMHFFDDDESVTEIFTREFERDLITFLPIINTFMMCIFICGSFYVLIIHPNLVRVRWFLRKIKNIK